MKGNPLKYTDPDGLEWIVKEERNSATLDFRKPGQPMPDGWRAVRQNERFEIRWYRDSKYWRWHGQEIEFNNPSAEGLDAATPIRKLPPLNTSVDPETGKLRKGGKYRTLKANGGERNHTPPKSVLRDAKIPLKPSDAPAAQMDKPDHRDLDSTGSGKKAEAFRKAQVEAAKKGGLRPAQEMEFEAMEKQNPGKNLEAINKAAEYTDSLRPEQLKVPGSVSQAEQDAPVGGIIRPSSGNFWSRLPTATNSLGGIQIFTGVWRESQIEEQGYEPPGYFFGGWSIYDPDKAAHSLGDGAVVPFYDSRLGREIELIVRDGRFTLRNPEDCPGCEILFPGDGTGRLKRPDEKYWWYERPIT